MRLCRFTFLLVGLASTAALADVTYTQSMKYTGGSMLEILQRIARSPGMARYGNGVKNVLEDQVSTVYLKGQKMARTNKDNSIVFDLDARTMTSIRHDKHTFTVQTFDEMRELLEHAQVRFGERPGDAQFNTKVEKLPQTRRVEGQQASRFLVTMNPKAGSTLSMTAKMDAWVVPLDDTKRAVLDYLKRLSDQFAYSFSGFALAMGPAGAGINAVMKESVKLDGYPVLVDVTISRPAPPNAAQEYTSREGAFIRFESECSQFHSGPIEGSRFEVPGDYKRQDGR